ncbi:MAG: TetR/AcrR family transcriptional regulator [Polyangiales bacterium]
MANQKPSNDWLNEERQELAVDRILSAAREVFVRDGIRSARMGNIAKAAGCARATLYRYFPNKEALLHEYMLRVEREFGEILERRLRELDAFGDRLVEAVATSVELIQEREDVAPFFSKDGLGLTAELTANAAAMRDRLIAQIERESSSSRIRGRLRGDVSAEEAAEWLTHAIFSFSVLPTKGRSGSELRNYLKKMLMPVLLES